MDKVMMKYERRIFTARNFGLHAKDVLDKPISARYSINGLCQLARAQMTLPLGTVGRRTDIA